MAERLSNRLKPKKEEIDLDIDGQFVELAEQTDEEIIEEEEEEEEAPAVKAEKKKVARDKKPKEEKEKKTKEKKKKHLRFFHKPFNSYAASGLKNLVGYSLCCSPYF